MKKYIYLKHSQAQKQIPGVKQGMLEAKQGGGIETVQPLEPYP